MSNTSDKAVRISVPPYEGERYEAEVPDTLDLAERAALAINAMTRVVAPEQNYEMFFVTEFAEDPPKLYLEWDGIFNTGKFLEALPLARIMCGSDFNLDVDTRIMESYLRGAGGDGLFYPPVENRPWAFYSEWNAIEEIRTFREPYGFIFGEGRLIMAMCMWYRRDGNPLWRQLVEKKIRRLLEMGYRKGDAISFDRYFVRGQVITKEPPVGIDYWVPYGTITYYQLTGHKPALEFARLQVNHLRKNWFTSDGRFLHGHFHLTAAGLIEILEYALTVGDEELVELAKNAYEYGKAIGEPLVGFFPETARKSFPTCESCEVADMIFLALRLTRAGLGDHWEDADRWVRNQFAEGQMTRTDWYDPQKIAAFLSAQEKEMASRRKAMVEEGKLYADDKDVLERSVGSWAGWALPNDWVNPDRVAIMHCCTGNAARTLGYIWDCMVTAKATDVQVNLLLNRASPWLDVDSHLPYEGKVVIKNKTATKLSVRIPEWVARDRVVCDANGAKREAAWSGNYIEIGGLKKGDVVTVEFPMMERSLFQVIGDVPYRLTLKGNTVVEIDPPGTVYPLYQREHYRQGKAPLKKVTRFVSAETTGGSASVHHAAR